MKVIKLIPIAILFFIIHNYSFSQNEETVLQSIKEKNDNYTLTLQDIDDAITLIPNLIENADLLFYKSSIYFDNENYALQIKTLLEANEYAEDLDLKNDIFTNLGTVYSILNNDELAIKHLQKAYDMAKSNNREDLMNRAYENIILYKIESGNTKALRDYEEFYKNLNNTDKCSKLETLTLLTAFQIDANLYDDASYYLKSIPFKVTSVDSCHVNKSTFYQNLALISIQKEDFKQSLSYLDSVPLKNLELEADRNYTYSLYIKNHKALGNYKLATLYNDSLVSFLDEKLNKLNEDSVDDMANEVIQRFENKKTINNQKLFILGAISCVFLLIIILFYFNKLKDNLKKKVDFQDNRYNGLYTNYKLSKNQLEKIKLTLSEQSKNIENTPDNVSQVKKLLTDLKIHENNNNDEVYKSINEAQSIFMEKISIKTPLLNNIEKLICFFISQNMSHKHIAELLNKSEKSIDSYKYRIKGKISKSYNTDLENFLKTL